MMERTSYVVVLLVLVSMVNCLDNSLDERWERFKTENKRKYNRDVEPYRRGIWEAKIKEIQQHNEKADQGVHSYWMQETEWDDLTFQEFMLFGDDFDVNDIHRVKRANRNGTGDCFSEQNWNDSSPYPFNKVTTLPTNVDWTRKGYVTSVKNQGSCGSCWAFSAVGALEGQWYKKSKKLVSLSPQFLVDCSTRNNGCGGGLPYKAFDFVIKNKGIPSESSYPYKAKDGTCTKSKPVVAKINGFRTINSEKELLNAVAYIGPVSVGIRTGPKITNVGQGVFTDCTGRINHAVLVVGYGVYNNKKVWKIKNSWSSNWGNKGYFYMTREVADACGIAQYASYPTVDGVARGPIRGGEVADLTTGVAVIPQLSVLAFTLSVTLALFNN